MDSLQKKPALKNFAISKCLLPVTKLKADVIVALHLRISYVRPSWNGTKCPVLQFRDIHSTSSATHKRGQTKRRPWRRIKHTFFSKEQQKDQKHVCHWQQAAVFMSCHANINAACGSRKDATRFSGHCWRTVAVRNVLTSTRHCNTTTEITAVTWNVWGEWR